MKKIYLLFVGIGLMFQSCVTTEEINVKSTGEMTYNLGFNFSEMLQSVPDKSTLTKGKEGLLEAINGKELSMEQLMDLATANDINATKKKDSLLLANPNFFKDTENLTVKMMLTDTVGALDLKIKAKNATDLNTSIKKLKEIGETAKSSGGKKADKTKVPNFVENSKYDYSKNVFARKVIIPENEVVSESDLPMGGMGNMFSYVIKVTFDKPIASVSLQDAKVSTDGKSFTKSFSLLEVIKNPKIIEYKVELKK